jgi:2-phosphosulfolactate phosphatase
MTNLEVLFAPTEFAALKDRDLRETVCVVFDVLRATSTMVTALANGATALIPVEEIAEAVVLHQKDPRLLLAGEREGVRIGPSLTGGLTFDLGNSPREFTAERVRGRTVVTTTTNGTRALRACLPARTVLIGSFLNLKATADWLEAQVPSKLLVVCSGTHDQAAYEDTLAAGALCDLVWPRYQAGAVADSTLMARRLYRLEQAALVAAVGQSRNGRHLLQLPELREDVAFCIRPNAVPLVAELGKDGHVRALAR